MPKAFTVEIKGLDKLLGKLDKKTTTLKTQVAAIIEETVILTNEEQVTIASAFVDTGRLRQLTFWEQLGELQFGLFSSVEYAPYIEFGTGGLVNVPEGLESYALQFKGKGIKQVNLPARPYFFPPFYANKAKMIQRIKEVLNK